MTPKQFEARIKRDMALLERRAAAAIRRTARKAVGVIRPNVPVAFGELRASLRAQDIGFVGHIASTVADAPHAAAVEGGSRPHLVPLDELIKWVKLRGMQGLTKSGRLRGKHWRAVGMGPTTRQHAMRVAAQLKGMESGGALDVNAPERIARAIQMAILHNGTAPHWFVLKSLPDIETVLDAELRQVFR